MFLAYLIMCLMLVLVVLGIEWELRRMEMSEGVKFSPYEIRWRRRVAIGIGIALFFALWFYVSVIHSDPVSFLAL